VHERLEGAVASMPAFDVEAGWSALVAQLEPPIAPVIRLRRRRPRRAMVLGVAAALVVGGSALAAVRHMDPPAVSVVPAMPGPGSGLVIGPRVHVAFSGAPPNVESGGDGHATAGRPDDRGRPHDGGGDALAGGSGRGSTGSGDPGGSGSPGGTPNQDSPDDTDHGSGNDGQHDDNGGGNDAQGQDSNGQGSNDNAGGSGGSASGDQGSNQQGTHDSAGGQGNGQ
jgi:hypothetical protein